MLCTWIVNLHVTRKPSKKAVDTKIMHCCCYKSSKTTHIDIHTQILHRDTHRHTDTHTHPDTNTNIHKHTQIHTDTDIHTHTYMYLFSSLLLRHASNAG